ncbi:hypothetical protein [Tenacibaculum bernardetii]|uniref:hypothetical protein n=1 Tax=Tenacibaculum bernardetii TaxID=3021375 RepID=UPI0023B13996|nr:hypothetical protein [Tenacibaculum bernardetii]
MYQKKVHIILISCALALFSNRINAQEIRVIDNKGTIETVNNNRVFTSATNPNNPTIITLENDIWFDTSATPNIVKIWDKTSNDWKIVNDNTPHTGTTGSVFFANTDGTPTEDNDQLFWNNLTKSLYIGNPLVGTNKLNVNGTIRTSGLNNADGTVGLPSYRFFNDSNTGMYSDANDELKFSTNGTNALTINANQDVSINEDLSVTGAYNDSSSDSGTNGQFLSSTATGTNWVDPNIVAVINKTTDYTLELTDNGKVFTFNSATDVTLTVPNGFPIGYNISIYQIGAGQVTIVGGATILNRLSRFKTAGTNAGVGLIATAADIFHLTGDLKR